MSQLNIVVLGGGVIGLTTAVCLQNRYGTRVNVTVITDKLSPHTTADGSAGFWAPYLLGDTPENKIIEWAKETYVYCHELWRLGLAEIAGVSFLPCITFVGATDPAEMPKWLSICHGVHQISEEQLKKFCMEHNRDYRNGFYFTTFICEPTKFLPYLLQQFITRGGNLVERSVKSLSELTSCRSQFDVVINCCGLSARTVVPDLNVFPIRGQVARVSAPWQYHVIFNAENYIIPNAEAVIVGGTHQENNYSTKVEPNDSKMIFDGCSELVPGLKNSQVISEWVGLRPGRNQVRLELEVNNDNMIVIHNYGHGGAGVTLSWGCALEVVDLLERKISSSRSRL